MKWCRHKARVPTLADIVFSGLAGLAFLVLGVLALIQIIWGEFTISAHFCRKYGLHFTTPAALFLFLGGIPGVALVWRARDLLRERRNKPAVNAETGR